MHDLLAVVLHLECVRSRWTWWGKNIQPQRFIYHGASTTIYTYIVCTLFNPSLYRVLNNMITLYVGGLCLNQFC